MKAALLLLASLLVLNPTSAATPHPNVVFICADDWNFDSVGCFGGRIPGLTPKIDKLAAEGKRLQYAYATVAVCQPVREFMLIAATARQKEVEAMRADVLTFMQRTGDPFADGFTHRGDRAVRLTARANVKAEFNKPAPKKKTPAAK